MRTSAALAVSLFLFVGLPSFGAGAITRPQTCPADYRLFELTTTEASIANVDISPDGKRLAFDLLGDIYVVPVEGGDAEALTQGNEWDVRPVWSPDGKRIAFISDRSGRDQVFVMGTNDEMPRQVTFGDVGGGLLSEGVLAGVEWMPDARSVVVNGYLVTIGNGESEPSRLFNQSGSMYHANGQALYQFRQAPGSSLVKGLQYEMRKLSPDKQWIGMGDLVSTSVIEAPLVSNNERWLIFKARRERSGTTVSVLPESTEKKDKGMEDVIVVRDRTTGQERVLVGPSTSPRWRSSSFVGGSVPEKGKSAVSWDSKYLFTAYGGGLHKVQISKVDIATGDASAIPISVEIRHCLEPIVYNRFPVGHAPLQVHNLRSASLRPDGNQLVFSALRSLYVMDVPGGKPRLIAPQSQGQFQPSYSPDGKWIAYVTWSETEGGQIWRVAAHGGVPERLTEKPGYYETPVWSPDSSTIAFVGSDDLTLKRFGFSVWVHEGSLQLLTLESKKIRSLAGKVRLGNPPSFSQDAKTIHYIAFEDPSSLQLRMRSISVGGGSDRDEGLMDILPSNGTAYAVPSPDGRTIAVTKNGNLYLVGCRWPIGDSRFKTKDCSESRITRAGAYDARWRKNGDELEWSLANVYYRARTADLVSVLKAGSGSARTPLKPRSESIVVNLVVPRESAKGLLAMKGARIITMRGDEVIENGVVLVEDGRILRVGSQDDVSIPNGADVVDLTGKTILPGFIDVHSHLDGLPRDLLDANNGEMLINLAFGLTTLRNPSHGGDHGYAYAELLETGKMVGPRLFGAEALVSSWQEIETFEDAIDIARRTKSLGGTFLKYHTGWDRQQRRWIIEAARQNGLNVAAHWPVSNFVPARLNLTTAIDGATTFEHGFSNTGEFPDVVKFVAQTGGWINFASLAWDGRYPAYYWDEAKGDERMRRFYVGKEPTRRTVPIRTGDSSLLELFGEAEINAKLISSIADAGGKVTIGSHGDYDGIVFHWELWAHVRGGMSTREVLRAATINGAGALGMDEDLGSIEAGKIADLIVLDKNPLEDIRNSLTVEQVMKDGVLRKSNTLDEIWPEQTKLPDWQMKGSVSAVGVVGLHTAH